MVRVDTMGLAILGLAAFMAWVLWDKRNAVSDRFIRGEDG